ncbi:protein of unknown function DUF732 [Mycolicibacterium rhodesiae JS60]|nr:protein of unknown function DUF732 [Mycolicibacterium rhodesiae JS60]
MRTCPRIIAGVLIAATLTLSGSPVATADDASFVSAAQALGFVHGPSNLILTGRSVCYFLSRKRDPGQVLERIIRYTRVEPDQARQFFALAIAEYCPHYAGAAGV